MVICINDVGVVPYSVAASYVLAWTAVLVYICVFAPVVSAGRVAVVPGVCVVKRDVCLNCVVEEVVVVDKVAS